ncbi:hypothetical protein SteCoe_2958 [Stentor coeruleus]|uniref:Uncharacterized protein n=1 Tax=Stentor coeruleus TaxID=5963 RepID=A0A1R2CYH5_9CILI|nr:hypothetical protein SteCoe_2958 [Stentor coeruleus]
MTNQPQHPNSHNSIKNFQDFLINCTELQKQVTQASSKICRKFIDQTLTKKYYKENKKTIRNENYFKGVQKIEEKIRQRNYVKNIENTKRNKNAIEASMGNDLYRILSPENVGSKGAVEFVMSSKRGFGSLEVVKRHKKDDFKVKNTELKINFDKSNLESLKCLDLHDDRSKGHVMFRNKSCSLGEIVYNGEDLFILNKPKKVRTTNATPQLPCLKITADLANRAKNEANSLFTNSKRILRLSLKTKNLYKT